MSHLINPAVILIMSFGETHNISVILIE